MSALVSTRAGGTGLSMCLSSDTLTRRVRPSFSWVWFYSFPMNVTAQLSWVMSYWMDSGNQHVHVCTYTHIHIYTHLYIHAYTHVHACTRTCSVLSYVYM